MMRLFSRIAQSRLIKRWPIYLPLSLFCLFLTGVFINSLKRIPLCSDVPAETREIVFTVGSGTANLYLMNADGHDICRLTEGNADNWFYDASWSPDGSHLVYVFSQEKNPEIYSMNAGGTQPQNLSNSPAIDKDPVWSPDGQSIAFASSRDQHWGIYGINVDGSHLREVYRTGNLYVFYPTWSPDGRKLAFLRTGHPIEPDGIYVWDRDKGDLTNLTTSNDSGPAWSPDGKQIAFVSANRDGNNEIYVMNADGSNVRRLTNSPDFDSLPSWSPDGKRIVFVSNRDASNSGGSDIYVMNADGTNIERLTRLESATSPSWLPSVHK